MRCFVYGTLRGGGELARVRGTVYNVSPRFVSFPVARFERTDKWIVGEVVDFEDEMWEFVVSMEEGAGYELVCVCVEYPADLTNIDGGRYEWLPAWEYIYEPRGPEILNGDWKNPEFAWGSTLKP